MAKTIKELKEEELRLIYGGSYCYRNVLPGETLQEIAEQCKVQMSTLMSLNGIKNEDLIYAGQRLKYPC